MNGPSGLPASLKGGAVPRRALGDDWLEKSSRTPADSHDLFKGFGQLVPFAAAEAGRCRRLRRLSDASRSTQPYGRSSYHHPRTKCGHGQGQCTAGLIILGDRRRLSAGASAVYPDKTVLTGNPVRLRLLRLQEHPMPPRMPRDIPAAGVLVAARAHSFFGEAIPEAVKLMPEGCGTGWRLFQQARKTMNSRYATPMPRWVSKADVSPFFADMAQKIANAHFVISRAGAHRFRIVGHRAAIVAGALSACA